MKTVVRHVALEEIVPPSWPLLARLRAGLAMLDDAARGRVFERVEDVVESYVSVHDGPAPRRLFSFLAQIEIIGVEVPLVALDHVTDPSLVPVHRRQLEDEIVHCLVFARLAAIHGGLHAPLGSAERLMATLRAEEDPRVAAVLLNLIGEGWIEGLFEHVAKWGVADDVFAAVLVDEARHHHDAQALVRGLDRERAAEAVRRFEADLVAVAQDPAVVLPLVHLGGEARLVALLRGFVAGHREALAELGMEPHEDLVALDEALTSVDWRVVLDPAVRPREIEPESGWRRAALQLWDAPSSPVMQGWTEVRVDHVPKRLLSPVTIAAIGHVWADYPRVNRFAFAGKVWRPHSVDVGVRVALGEQQEAVSTVLVTHADRRSVRDIVRIIRAGHARLEALGDGFDAAAAMREATPEGIPVADPVAAQDTGMESIRRDEDLMSLLPPDMVQAPVTFTNVGRAGLHAGFGAMPGLSGQSIEVVMGRIEKKPAWRGLGYWPTPMVTMAFNADHRVVDGTHVGEGMRRFEATLSKHGVKGILARPDTLPAVDDDEMGTVEDRHALAAVVPLGLGGLVATGLGTLQNETFRFTAKCPWILPWKCKK